MNTSTLPFLCGCFVPRRSQTSLGIWLITYPIVLTRDLHKAKNWLRTKTRGTERIGLVASSGAQRLRPEGIHIKAAVEPPNWFLNDASDVIPARVISDSRRDRWS